MATTKSGKEHRPNGDGSGENPLSEVSDVYLKCRDLGHDMGEPRDYVLAKTSKGTITKIRRIRQCLRCFTGRSQTIEVFGFTIESTEYFYPEGYLVKERDGKRPKAADARREAFDRGMFRLIENNEKGSGIE